jgi:hypothetical protein
MKKLFLGSLMLIAAAPTFAGITPDGSEVHCFVGVNKPAGSKSFHYFSDDCHTVNIVPAETSAMKVNKIVIEKDADCKEAYISASDNLKGAIVHLDLKIDLKKEVEAYRKANLNAPVKFRIAPIENGVISYLNKDKSIVGSKIKLPEVGKGHVQDMNNDVISKGVRAEVYLSLAHVCARENSFVPMTFDGGFDAKYSYEIPMKDQGAGEEIFYSSDFVLSK